MRATMAELPYMELIYCGLLWQYCRAFCGTAHEFARIASEAYSGPERNG
jgi:hypothetical protein